MNPLTRVYPDPSKVEEQVMSTEEDTMMSTNELEDLVEQLKQEHFLIEEETKSMGSFFKSHAQSQQLKVGGDGAPAFSDQEEASDMSGGESTQASGMSSMKKKAGRSRRRSSAQRDLQMQVEWKLEVASYELEKLKQDKEEEIKAMEKNQENVRAVMEEAELRIQETRKDRYEFKRDIVGDRKVVAEKILKYLEERIRLKDTHVTKLKLKAQGLKTQIAKYEHQLKQREDMGEVLHAIDFDQLKIENQQFLEKIETRNKELVKLKLTTGNTVQSMNALTEKLNKFSQEQAWLRKEIKQRQDHLERLAEDIKQVQKEKEAAQKKNTQLRLQHEAVKVPKVEDYIEQKAEQFELEKAAANWKRKVEIAEGQKKIVLQQKHKLNATRTVAARTM